MANLSNFDLNLLKVLDALLTEQSTVRAAERLGLSQPAVSAALARLRTGLGDELLFRQGQGLTPTRHAESLRMPLRSLIQDIEALIATRAEFEPSGHVASYRLSGSDFFAELLMPQLAEYLQKTAPGIRIHLVDLSPGGDIDLISRGEIEIALIPREPVPRWIESRPAMESRFVVIARRDHPDLKAAGVQPGEVLPLDLFCELGHVLFSPEGKSKAMGDQALARIGRERRVVMSLPVFWGVHRAVATSDLIALLPEPLASRLPDHAGIAVYEIPMPMEAVPIDMYWSRRMTADPAHAWMRDRIAAVLADLVPSSRSQTALGERTLDARSR